MSRLQRWDFFKRPLTLFPGERKANLGFTNRKWQGGMNLKMNFCCFPTSKFPESHRSFQEVQVQMNNSAVNLNQAASEIVTASRGPPQQVAESSSRFSRSYADFMDSGLVFAGATKDQENRRQIVSGLRSVSMMSSKLLLASKSLQADPNAPNSKNLLAQAAR